MRWRIDSGDFTKVLARDTMEVQVMTTEKDFRIRIDLTFPPEMIEHADRLKDILSALYVHAVVINEDKLNAEPGFIDVERCGHRLGISCDRIARWEVGKGRVI